MQNKSIVLTLLDRQNPDKANLQTLIEIVKDMGEIPSTLVKPDTKEYDFEIIAKIIYYAAKQHGEDVTLEDVMKRINVDNFMELCEYATHFMTLTIPKEVQKRIDELNKANDKASAGDGDKKPKKDVGES